MAEINPESFSHEALGENSASRAQNYSGGIETARGLLDRPDNYSQNLGGGNAAMSQAIRNKYGGQFSRDMDRLKLDNIKNANADHLKKLEVATQLATQEHEMNLQKELQRKREAQAKKAMRAQLVGSVLGIVGGVGGAMIPGAGAAGMIAGQSLGQGVGMAAGGGL